MEAIVILSVREEKSASIDRSEKKIAGQFHSFLPLLSLNSCSWHLICLSLSRISHIQFAGAQDMQLVQESTPETDSH